MPTQPFAGTALETGGAAIISYQEDGDTVWSIVLLEDIIAGTEISFTDNGWRASGGFNPVESEGLTFTAGSGLSAGTVVVFRENGPGFDATLVDGTTPAGTVTGDRLGLSSAGDQIIMYQGSFDPVTGDLDPGSQLISAYHANGAWDADSLDDNTSALPPELVDYSVDQSVLGEEDNAVYVGPTSGSPGQIWTLIQNQANWVGGGSPTSPPYGPGFDALTNFTVDNTNTLPTISVPAGLVFEVDSTANTITALSVGDVDNDRLTVTLTVEGDLTLAQTTGLNFLAGDGTADATMTFSGRVADINAALDGMLYAPAAGDDDGDAINISVSDGSATITQGSFPASVDLDTLDGTNGFLIEGLVERDQLGYSVANAGDVNGDGIDDLIIGAPYAENGLLDAAGKAYVIYGNDAGFSSSFDVSTLDGTNGFELTTGVAGDELGHSVSGIGDVNGDGIDDFALGSFKAHVGAAADAGKAWIVFGNASGFPSQVDVDTLDGTDGFVFNGVNADDYAGRVVSGAGDINGDGIDDILVSGDRTDPNGVQQAGATYVIYGSNSGFNASLSAGDIDGTNGSLIAGEEAASQTGRMVKAAGDVNGDGFDDLVIGAYKATADGDAQAGKTYVVFGGSGGLGAQLDLGTLDGTNGFSVDGIAAGDQSGRGVSSAGDINGDGFDDILIGAPESGSGGASSGGAYVVFGSGAGFAANIDLASLDGTNGFAITGEGPSKRTGFDVSELGDINGDGIDDILLGGRASSGVEGKSYVVFGSATGFGASFDLGSLDGSNGFELPEVVFGDRVGFSVSSAGDVNDDGINDLVIGANGADPAGANAGEVYVVFGNANISQNFITDSVAISHVYAPVIANLDGDMVTHTEGDLLTLLDAGGDLLVSDTDSADFDGGRLSVSFTGFQAATDGLAIDTSGAVALSAGQVAGSDVSVNGTVIGTIAAGETGASNEGLAIDLNGDATPIAVQALLAAIGYTNGGGDTPDETTRTFDVALTDGDGGDTTVSTSVDVVAVDDAPLLAVPAGQSFAVNSAGNVISGVSVDDVDTASVQVTVSAEGAVTLAQTSGLTFIAGADGTSSMTFSGSLTDVNAALATLGYTPASDDRDGDSLSVTVDDGTTPVTDSIAIALTNTDPQANDDALGVGEDGPALAGSLFDDNGNGADGDANGDLLTVSAVDGEAGDVAQPLTLASGALLTVNSDGTFTYDPNGAFETLDETETATEAFTYTVDDGFGGSDTATATVTIAGANDVSQLTLPAAQSFAVNSAGNTIAGLAVSDVDDATVTVTLTAEGAVTLASVTGLSFSDGADGSSSMTFSGLLADVNTAIATLGYTPANGDRDGDSVAITIDDGTDTTTGNIGVTLTNTEPVAGDDAFGLVESASLVGGDLFADNGSGIDDDANGDMLTVTAVNGETADVGVQLLLASGALLTVNANGTYDYDTNGAFDSLASGETASETFTYTVDDGFGGSDTATVTLTINGENDAPLANDDALAVSEDGPVLSGDVFADNGNGADTDPNGDDISIVSVNGQAGDVGQPILLASGALLTLNTDGTFSYDTNGAFEALDTGELATDSFIYTVQDTFGATGSATATVTIDGVNDAPTVAVPGAQAFLANSAGHTLTGFAVDDADDATLLVTLSADGALTLAQDSGLIFTLGDGDADSAMAFTGTLTDINAALSSLVYSPATGDRDGDSINLTAFDFDATASDSVTVDLQNSDPVTTDDAFTLGDTGPAVSGNLFADNGNGSDANGDLLSVGAVNGASVNVGVPLLLASGALVTVNSDGTFTYDPNGAFDFLAEGFTGQDSFTYTADDGFGGSATSTVNLTLTGSQDGDDVAILTGLDDTLSGGVGNDDINGSAGNDTLYGDDGDDRLVGAAGADVLHGGDGSDFLGGGNGNDELFGGAGNDELQGSSGDDRVIGQAGDDVLYGDVGNDFLGGGNGNDELFGGDGDDTLQGAAGNDRVIGQNGNDTVFGGDGDDFVRGAAGDDILHGDLGDDELRGDNGEDQLFGGAGNDDLFGGADNDLLQGADGDDMLFGDSGDDTLLGGLGNDFLGGGAGNDVIDGEDGNDDLRGALGNDELDGGAGDDILYGNEGDDVLGGGNGNDQLFGGSGADQMQGSEGDDLLGGGAGGDTLLGGVGNDDLRGGGGDDVLAGQEGDDVLLGDTGSDTFVFAFAEPGNDTVLDFEAGETVRLDGFAYATAAEAAEDFAQVGNDVVFTLGNQTATFKNADLADVVAGIELTGGAITRVAAPPADDGLALKAFDQFDFGGVAGADDINELDFFPDLMTGAPASSRELMPATAEDAFLVDTLLDGDVEDAFASLDFDWMS